MADIFREVDEEVRQENLKKLWKKYGLWGGGVSVVIIVIVAGWQGWKSYDLSQRQAQATLFYQAEELFAEQDFQGAAELLAGLEGVRSGYDILARFKQAQLAVAQGRTEDAVAIWDGLSDDAVVGLSDLATLLAALHFLEQGDHSAAGARVARLLRGESSFYSHALELQGLIALEDGDKEAARQSFEQLRQDSETPGYLKARVARLLSVIEE